MKYKLVLFYHQKAVNLGGVQPKNASHRKVKKLYSGSVVDVEEWDTIGRNVKHQFLYPIKMETRKVDGCPETLVMGAVVAIVVILMLR
ncbi:hypothetical protein Q3G72_032361 [Acer saccharum]|nr:hypothetical protein Q3G72_032361 [Acer saccharum]